MNKNLAIVLMIIIGILGFIVGYSLAPTDVGVVRHGVTTTAADGGDSGGGYGGHGGGYGGDSGGYGGDSGGYGGGHSSGGGYGQ